MLSNFSIGIDDSNIFIDNSPPLGEQQSEALNRIEKFLKDENKREYLLSGSAGTGKTYTLMHVLRKIRDLGIDYRLCAPTHKAALVMEQYTKENAITIHSLLAMSPKLDVLNLNFNELQFNSKDSKEFPRNGIVICDESSMINDDLYKFLVCKCEDYNSKILYVADFKQLQPVKQKTKSKIQQISDQYTLTHIYRQSNESALVEPLITLRDTFIKSFNNKESEQGSLKIIKDLKELLVLAIKEFKDTIGKDDILQTKVLAYTNKQVNLINATIHKYLFKTNEPYCKHEILMCTNNMTRNNLQYWNSMDYIIVQEPEKTNILIPNFGIVPGYELELYDSLAKVSGKVQIIDSKYPNFEELALTIEGLRLNALEEKVKFRKSLAWKEYFKTVDSFVSPKDLYYDKRLIYKKGFTYGYAISTHKSQGSTYNKVFIDMQDIFKQKDLEELRQLQYVALSRTKHDAYIYVN